MRAKSLCPITHDKKVVKVQIVQLGIPLNYLVLTSLNRIILTNEYKFKTFLVFFRPVLNLIGNYEFKMKELSQRIQNHY